jgi:hypothetical protein
VHRQRLQPQAQRRHRCRRDERQRGTGRAMTSPTVCRHRLHQSHHQPYHHQHPHLCLPSTTDPALVRHSLARRIASSHPTGPESDASPPTDEQPSEATLASARRSSSVDSQPSLDYWPRALHSHTDLSSLSSSSSSSSSPSSSTSSSHWSSSPWRMLPTSSPRHRPPLRPSHPR